MEVDPMAAPLVVSPRIVPLTSDESGVLRVTGTRIPLERIIEWYLEGITPEAIVEAFDSLRLSDVYVIISYYLDHSEEVNEYLRLREVKADEVRSMIAAGQAARPGMGDELRARERRADENQGRTRGQGSFRLY
jgi:uncharacterized protein (DUF433 family)